jgi:hypothetical protein
MFENSLLRRGPACAHQSNSYASEFSPLPQMLAKHLKTIRI